MQEDPGLGLANAKKNSLKKYFNDEMKKKVNKNTKNNNSSNSLVFGWWLQTKMTLVVCAACSVDRLKLATYIDIKTAGHECIPAKAQATIFHGVKTTMV